MPMLSVTLPGGGVESRVLGAEQLSLGRGPENEVVLDTPFVSRRHAIVAPTANGYSIQDLGSKNGTWVNGNRLGADPQNLSTGDTIVLGNNQVMIRFSSDDSTVTVSSTQQ